MGLFIAANDPVATDHICARIMQVPIRDIPSLKLAMGKNLGSTKYRVIGNQIQEVKVKFKRPTTMPQKIITDVYVLLRKYTRSITAKPKRRRSSAKKVKVGIIGLGAASEILHLPALSSIDNCEVVAASEKDPLRRQRRKEKWNIHNIYDDYETMFNKEDLDAVFICLPSFLHYDAVKCALEHHVHVFCEKPMGLSSEKAHELVNLATKSNLSLAVGYSRMLYEGYKTARDLIKSHQLGKILQVHGILSNAGPYASWTPRSDWFFDEKGGGVIFDTGSHLFSEFLHVLDDRIAEVSGISAATYGIAGMNDQLGGCFKTEKGILGTFNVGWRAANESDVVAIIGSAGSLVIDSIGVEKKLGKFGPYDRLSNSFRTLWKSIKLQLSYLYSSSTNTISLEDEAFINAVLGKGAPLFRGEDAVHILAVLEAVKRSSETGTKMTVTSY
jgi:predicted dehydrogenase